MPIMRRWSVNRGKRVVWIVLAAVIYGGAFLQAWAPSQQQPPADPAAYKDLPPGAGKAALIRMCSICHELERVLAVRHTPQEWATVLENMSQRGASGTDEEWDALFEYLSEHFAPRPRGQTTAPTGSRPASEKGASPADSKVRPVFTTAVNGGSIQLVAPDAADAAAVAQIRVRLRETVKRFASGDYASSELLGAQRKPGTESLRAFAAQIKYDVEEVPGGGKILISATAPEAVAAIHAFLQAQQRPER